MGGGHLGAADHHHLLVRGTSPVHRLGPEAKVAGLVAFVAVVALTARRNVAAAGVDAALVLAVLAVARVPAVVVLRRLAVVLPFLGLAALVPFVAGGRQVDVLGLDLSEEGLWAAWGIASKAVVGTAATIALAATTSIPDVLHGLTRLRVPTVLVSIMAFMFRSLDIVVDQVRRMRAAMTARCHDPRWLWQARPMAAAAGTLFVRSYERSERVHQAMSARGFTGAMPELDTRRAAPADWLLALIPAALALAAALVLR